MSNEVDDLKNRGNESVRDAKYEEAMLYYTQAIKLEPKDYTLYSNRSLTFLRMSQYYHAMQDAKETIRLNPSWAKGYYRLGEVQRHTFQFVDALLSYKSALELQPNDMTIIEALAKTAHENQKEKKADVQIPWLGAGLGIILGVAIVISDYTLTQTPSLSNPVLMALLTISIAMIGYGIARCYRYYIKCQRDGLLEPPINLITGEKLSESDSSYVNSESDISGSNNTNSVNSNHRYTKAQARFRYKKGRS